MVKGASRTGPVGQERRTEQRGSGGGNVGGGLDPPKTPIILLKWFTFGHSGRPRQSSQSRKTKTKGTPNMKPNPGEKPKGKSKE